VIEAFDLFTSRYANEYAIHKKPCIIILDNASMHTSDAFLAQQDNWAARGVLFHYLPPYSPELNLIEILWRKVNMNGCLCRVTSVMKILKKSVVHILSNLEMNTA